MIGTIKFETRILELVDGVPELVEIVASLLDAQQKLREQVDKLYQKLLSIIRQDEVCKRLMTIPGVGPFVLLKIPARFSNSKAIGAALGLTPRLN